MCRTIAVRLTGPSGHVSHQSGSLTGPSGHVSHQSGSLTGPSGHVSHHCGSLTGPSGHVSHQSGSLTGPSGHESHQSGSLTGPSGMCRTCGQLGLPFMGLVNISCPSRDWGLWYDDLSFEGCGPQRFTMMMSLLLPANIRCEAGPALYQDQWTGEK
ncbi:hypothetical protein niasHT_026742 [Heterodera trifolii]|uniref:Uncharacterized protein n=1 Tax=Heterodera trifolii TaxID=157864 RepID=A0ABD2JNI9_9BILA